jgi:hypothetical protein
VTPLLQPMPSFTRESGDTLHVVLVGVNRIGKDATTVGLKIKRRAMCN